MRALTLGSVIALSVMPVAWAAENPMADTFGNTVISKSANGESRTHYKKDGTLDATLSSPLGSITLSGTWKLNDKGELCRTYSNPPPMLPIPNPLCTPFTQHKVGDSWTVKIGDQSRTVTLVQGIQ
ncbi:MAG: hypothetical protein JOZ55_00840 [Alphaproteobacteria bacterium]|nr:hypothetical protein [Alphaproteobacteria bacterium]